MENKDSLFTFPWGDNWWIDGDRAWFASGMQKILFGVNLNTDECESAVRIPDESPSAFRQMPRCIKCGDDIFCMPVYCESIWVYNIRLGAFSKISICNPDKKDLFIFDFWEYGNKLFAVSMGMGQVIEISIKEKKIERYYSLCKERGVGKSIRIGTLIYSLSETSDAVYCFDMDTKDISMYRLPDIGRKISSCCFCFDGEKFWMVGQRKEVYVWDMKKNSITTIGGFPKEFGVYDFSKETDGEADCGSEEYELPTFLYSASGGGYVWFMPYQTNKIIYVDKKTYEVHSFEVPEEDETAESLMGRMSLRSKYILEYVKGDRHIGLFSLKNNCMIEIDAAAKKYKIKHYVLNEKCIREMAMAYYAPVLYESSSRHRQIFKYALSNRGMAEADSTICGVGEKIYTAINSGLENG